MVQNPDLSELITTESIQKLATPANYRYGQAMHAKGAVKDVERTSRKAEAWVGGIDASVAEGGGSRRRTQLAATPDGLQWQCACTPKDHAFCKHCVALALSIVKSKGE